MPQFIGIALSVWIIYSEFLSVFTYLGTNMYLLLTWSLSNRLMTWHLCSKCLWDTKSKVCSSNIHSPTRHSLHILWYTKKSNTLDLMTESCMENITCMQHGQAMISNPTFALANYQTSVCFSFANSQYIDVIYFPFYFLRFLLLK